MTVKLRKKGLAVSKYDQLLDFKKIYRNNNFKSKSKRK